MITTDKEIQQPSRQVNDYKSQRMENAHYWAAQLLGWMENGPNAGLNGTYYVDIIGGKPVLVMHGDHWQQSNIDAIYQALINDSFPESITTRINSSCDGHHRLFINSPPSRRLQSSWYPHKWQTFTPIGGSEDNQKQLFETGQLSEK